MSNTINASDAEELLAYLIERLRVSGLAELADQIDNAGRTPVVRELTLDELAAVSKRVKGDFGTKSVRGRSAVERLEVAVEQLDALLRQSPAAASRTADLLDKELDALVFALDATGVEVDSARSQEEFSLSEFSMSASDEHLTMYVLETLWDAVGREVKLIAPGDRS